MTISAAPAASGAQIQAGEDLITVTIDGFEVAVPKGTLVIRAAELIGIQIPRFCDHPLLEPVGACRQCLVEVEGQRKPIASCTTTVTDGMVVKTQLTSPVADKAQQGVMELLLINHPLDCPICDKGGECPLQNQAMSNGRAESRFRDNKRTYPKPINISSQVLLDRERCVLCARCTRFSQQIAGDPFIELLERGALQQVGIYEKEPFESYFSGNTVQICPVGALTGAAYRFRARPFDLVSTPTVCEHCASGCALRTDWRRGKVMRRLAGDDPEVNEEWNCDKGRWAFQYATAQDRLTVPLVREDDGTLVPTSWADALDVAARGLAAARGSVGVLVGGRATLEDAYGYAKFARVALGTNDIDMRARPFSEEEADFLAHYVAGQPMGPTYDDLERASTVLLVGFEPEEESPIVFLRLRKAVRRHGMNVLAVAPYASWGLQKLSGRLLPTMPGAEPTALEALRSGTDELAELVRGSGTVILVGERMATVRGALSAVASLADAVGATVGWVPRRAGERGAVEAGALPALLPGGRPVSDAEARTEMARAWGVSVLPDAPGRDTGEILAAASRGELGALLVGGVDPDDLPDPAAVLAALDAVPFLVSLELRSSAVTDRADVVLPVAAVVEKAGTFVDWEGRQRPFEAALPELPAMPDVRVLHVLADAMDVHLGLPDVTRARREIGAFRPWSDARPEFRSVPGGLRRPLERGQVVLATWHELLDAGRMQDNEEHLAGTARRPVARMSVATAARVGATDRALVTVSSTRGSVTLPLVVTHSMVDDAVWLPANARGCSVHRDLGVAAGDMVWIDAEESR